MRTIESCIDLLRRQADILIDRAVRERERGKAGAAYGSAYDAAAYRRAADYLEAQMREDEKEQR